MNIRLTKFFTWIPILAFMLVSALPVRAAKVAFRLTVKDGVLQQYYDNPNSFPICREKLGYMSFSTRVDPLIRNDGERLFLTTQATSEVFRGAGANFTFTGEETVNSIRDYENQGFTVGYVIIYHEDWLLLGGPGGPYSEDIRILSPQELANVRAAIAASDLRSKNTVKIIQLLGARVDSGNRGDSWTQIVNNPALMAHLRNFDGIGTECHVGDHDTSINDGPETLDAMAQITQWCVQNGKTGFVFMGGAAGSYTQLASMRSTYNYLWSAMDALGVSKDRTDLLYFRQGAREGTHLPESSASLTFQVAELIGKVKNVLDDAQPPTITAIADRVANENTSTGVIAFTVGDADTAVGSLTLSATSSNTVLVPNSGIVLGGSGANRTINVTPALNQMGTTDITVSVSDGLLSATRTFRITVGGALLSNAADASVKEDPQVDSQTSGTTQVGAGGNSPWVDRATVYVFQLPNLGAVANPFKSSSFIFNYVTKDGTLKNNDLYGLGRRDAATVLSSDYYGQTTTSDPTDATRLQTNILTNTTPLGPVATSSSGNTALLNYLNAQYASGAGIGKYVFLRLNTSEPKNGINRATLTMSEGGVSSPTDTRPRIVWTGNSAPTISTVNEIITNVGAATEPIAFSIGDGETAAGSLIVSATSSNTALIPNANIVLGGSGANRTVNITPVAGQTGTAVITIQVSDGSRIGTMNFTVNVLHTLYADLADSAPRQIDGQAPSILAGTATDATLFAGRSGAGGTVDRCVVFPFQLPDLGATSTPFTSALFLFDLVSNNFSPLTCNLDLYGLGVRTTPTVLASDLYSETNVADPTSGTTRLRDNLCTAATPAGLISTGTSGSSALVNYLNAQYAGGANVGKYVFLRLSKDTANGTNSSQYLVTSADGASAAANNAIWPRIGYTAIVNTPPTITDITDRSIAVNTSTGAIAFTIGDNETAPASLTLSKASSNPALVPVANIVFGGSGANRSVTVTPNANQLGSSAITVTVSDGSLTTTDTFVLTVTGTASETWRFTHFGTTANTGTAADAFDANNDGETNLLEFATGQSPSANTLTTTPLATNGANLEFTYTRSKAAMTEGVQFAVEWTDSFGSWSNAGITEQIVSDTDTVQTIKATLAMGMGARRFMHLRVAR